MATSELLAGTWEGGDTAAQAIYGFVKIHDRTIEWGRKREKPSCKTNFKIVDEPPGVSFQDQTGNRYVTASDSKFTTMKLRIAKRKCTGQLSYLRFTFRPDLSGYAAVVEYEKDDAPQGFIHFFKH